MQRLSQRWSDDMVEYHDLDKHEAVARVLGSKMFTTRSSTCHGITVSCVDVVIVFDYDDWTRVL